MKKILLFLTLAASSVSCVDMLDTVPSNQIASSVMWSTEALADKGINGLYKYLYADLDGNHPAIGRLQAGLDRVGIEGIGFTSYYYSNNYPPHTMSDQAKSAGLYQVWYEWKFCYTVIHACNDAIANLGKAGLDQVKYDNYMCQALFMRAWSYQRLNMLYQGVPIYLEPVDNAACNKTQSSAAEVWKVVIDDLTACINNENFVDNSLEENYGRPSKGAAYSLRGMAYMWTEEFALAEADFKKVEECGYGLWDGAYIDFFSAENEKSKEMIFSIQYEALGGIANNMQHWVGGRDMYDGWDLMKPSTNFVDSYKNADGSDFVWSEVPGLEDWGTLTTVQREVFFCRDGLNSNSSYATMKSQVVSRVGQDIFDKYYQDAGNEARIKVAYENRDPRLEQTVLTPYTKITCYSPWYNSGNEMADKEYRWPLFERGSNGGDVWLDKRNAAFYLYKKYNATRKDDLIQRELGDTDWPLIRYTDVLLQMAEAQAQQGKIAEAVASVNLIRSRAGMPALSEGAVGGQEGMMEAIRYERRVELCLEGVNYFDEVRWGTYKETKFQNQEVYKNESWWGGLGEYNCYWNDCLYPWPAPLGEAQRNPNLVRAEGWVY